MPTTHTVSWSEIDCFRQCPLKHELAYKQRWSKPPVEGSPLSRGSLFHLVMENHYSALRARDVFGRGSNKSAEHIAMIDALLNRGHRKPLQTEEQALVEWMYDGYVECYGDDLDWEVVAVEYANEFWLPTERGGRSNYKVKMKIDLVIKHRPTGLLWVVDHKSNKELPTDRMLELDDQFGLYVWGMRRLGKRVAGAIHNSCRTFQYKDPSKPYPLDSRFKRTMLYRTDEELDTIAVEAYKTARRAWAQTREGDAERTPNSDTCRWRCDYTETCLGARKDRDPAGYLNNSLTLGGFTQNRERH